MVIYMLVTPLQLVATFADYHIGTDWFEFHVKTVLILSRKNSRKESSKFRCFVA